MKDELPKHEESYKKSNENEIALEETLNQTRLSADEALVKSRQNLLDKHKSLSLKKKEHRKYFSKEMADQFYKIALPKVYKELGVDMPTGKDKKPSGRFIDMILESYHGVTRDIITQLIDSTRDTSKFVDTYIQNILPKHLDKLASHYRVDAHAHLKDESKEHRIEVAKKAGLDNVLDETGLAVLAHEDNYHELGKWVRYTEKNGPPSKDYIRQSSQLLTNFVKDEETSSKKAA